MKCEKRVHQKLMTAALVMGTLLATGCAGNSTIPSEKIASAEKALSEARESSAATGGEAAPELKNAEYKLGEAKDAMKKKEYENASRLADSATVDVELAQAEASTAKSKKAAEEMRESIKSLQRELDQTPTR
jgi:hypothetical protein